MAKKVKKIKAEKAVKLNPPQMVGHAELQAFFASDPEVTVGPLDHDLQQVVVTVKELEKFQMLNKLIGGVHADGNMRWTVKVVLADGYNEVCSAGAPEQTFRGNKNYDRTIHMPGALSDLDVIIFKPVIVQVPVDDAFNPDGGIVTYTYEQLAAKIFAEKFLQAKFTTSALKSNKK